MLVASKRLQDKENVDFKELTGCDLSIFEDNSFDVIYCSVVFMHLNEWDRFHYITEAYRVLKSKGRAYFDNFNLQSKEGGKPLWIINKYLHTKDQLISVNPQQ